MDSSAEQLQHIRQMMERSTRFVSLSGLSGIGAGICGLAGAWFAGRRIGCGLVDNCDLDNAFDGNKVILDDLLWIAVGTFLAAFITAFLFTWLRSRRQGVAMTGTTTKRLFWNTAIPVVAGGIFLYKMMESGNYTLVAPGCLIFYGIALMNASKYTLGEIRYLGYVMIILGIINLWLLGYGLLFWALGFGVMHIIYGIWMWLQYERNTEKL